MEIGAGAFFLGDCFDHMAAIPDGSVDMILADLPYGTTQNKWDSILPLEPLWREYWRVCKPNAPIVLTAAQPFTSMLVSSQMAQFKYDWIWAKESGTGHLNAKKMPLRDKEDILVFCRGRTPYFPQFGSGVPYKGYNSRRGDEPGSYGKFKPNREGSDGRRYPTQILKFTSNKVSRGKGHPTQKPVALFEYLIRTYTNPGDLVLDNTAGSGTTAVACENAGRRWICIEKDPGYYWNAIVRVVERVAA